MKNIQQGRFKLNATYYASDLRILSSHLKALAGSLEESADSPDECSQWGKDVDALQPGETALGGDHAIGWSVELEDTEGEYC